MWNCNNWTGGLPFGSGNFFMGFGPLGGLLSLLLFILIICLTVKIIRSFIPNPDAASDKNDSLGFLKNKLAKGEITLDEYQRLREVLIS